MKYPLLTQQWLKALRNIHACYEYRKRLIQQKLLVLFYCLLDALENMHF